MMLSTTTPFSAGGGVKLRTTLPVARFAALVLALGLGMVSTRAADARPAAKMPKGHVVAEGSQSPDKKYGVTAFDNTKQEEPEKGPGANTLIELKTGRVIAALDTEPATTRINNGEIMPARWSPDSSLLLWEVDGKWFHDALVLVRLENGKLLWQRNVMRLLQQEILARTRKVEPKKYAKVKKDHEGWGSAYPDGFAVEVEALDPIAFPLRVRATLASETKTTSILDSHLEGEINAAGELKITKFALGPGHARNF